MRVWAWRQPGEERGLILAVAVGGADSLRLPTCPPSEHFLSGAWVLSERPLPWPGPWTRGQVGGWQESWAWPHTWGVDIGQCHREGVVSPPGRATSPGRSCLQGLAPSPLWRPQKCPLAWRRAHVGHLVFILGRGPGASGKRFRVVGLRDMLPAQSTPGSPGCGSLLLLFM